MMKLTYLACDFNTIDKNEHHSFNEDSFVKYLDNPHTKNLIRRKVLLGALSHKCRTDYMNYVEENRGNCSVGNPSDYILATKEASNAITDAYIKDHKLYISVETLPTENGILLEKLIQMGMDLQVSMSTELDIIDDEYHIVNLFGLDHTISPAFTTSLVSVDKIG